MKRQKRPRCGWPVLLGLLEQLRDTGLHTACCGWPVLLGLLELNHGDLTYEYRCGWPVLLGLLERPRPVPS